MRKVVTLAVLMVVGGSVGEAQDRAAQIAGALKAAPEQWREGAAVVVPDPEGNNITLRAGSNDLVCLADDPVAEGFSVACYHKDLDPYMMRGRQLKAQGVEGHLQQRWQEIEAGTLEYPDRPNTLWVLTGAGFDPATGDVVEAYLRSVIYHPYATAEATGLPTSRMGAGLPWLMFPGTVGAHIMISPPRNR